MIWTIVNMDDQRLALLARVASLYYEDGMNQNQVAEELGYSLDCYQSNAEHELVDRVQKAARDDVQFILLNPGAFTHTSVALRDALLAVDLPFIEIHLSNTFAREEFRHKSYFSDIAEGCVIGLGAMGYELALQAAAQLIADGEEE